MPAIIAPGVVRYSVNAQYAGRPVVNLLDVHIDGEALSDRDQNVFDQAGIVINEWCDHVLPLLDDNYLFQSVSWIDLDSENGSTGIRTSTSQETLPQVGGRVTQGMPGNVAFRIIKGGTARRGQRSGRLYLAGVAEADTEDTNPNVLTNARVTAMTTPLADLLSGINQESGTGTYDSWMVVIHTVGGAFEAESRVTSLTVDRDLGSQRRRLTG